MDPQGERSPTNEVPNRPSYEELLRLVTELKNLVQAQAQKIRELEWAKQYRRKNIRSKQNWYRGLGVGIFSTMIMVGIFSKLNILENDKLAVLAFSIAIMGAFISLLNRRNRS